MVRQTTLEARWISLCGGGRHTYSAPNKLLGTWSLTATFPFLIHTETMTSFHFCKQCHATKCYFDSKCRQWNHPSSPDPGCEFLVKTETIIPSSPWSLSDQSRAKKKKHSYVDAGFRFTFNRKLSSSFIYWRNWQVWWRNMWRGGNDWGVWFPNSVLRSAMIPWAIGFICCCRCCSVT